MGLGPLRLYNETNALTNKILDNDELLVPSRLCDFQSRCLNKRDVGLLDLLYFDLFGGRNRHDELFFLTPLLFGAFEFQRIFELFSGIRGRSTWRWRLSLLANIPSFSVKLRQATLVDG